MHKVIDAVFEDGVFKPIGLVDFLKTKWVKLRIEPVRKPKEPSREWARKLIQGISKGKKPTLDSEFARGLSVRQYFAMSEEERERLWEKWHKESEQEVKKIEAKELKLE